MHSSLTCLMVIASLSIGNLLLHPNDARAQCGTLSAKELDLELYLRQFADPERQAFRERHNIQELAPDVERHVETGVLVCGPLRKRVREELERIMGGPVQHDQFDLSVLTYGGLYHVVPIRWVIPESANLDVVDSGMVLFFDAQTLDFITWLK